MNKKSKLIIGISAVVLLIIAIIMVVIFSGKKSEVITYKVQFDSGNGNLTEQSVNQGETAEEPQIPTKEGYIFIGWKYEGEIFDFSKAVNKDVTLVAEWQKVEADVKTFVVKFNTDGGTTLANQVIEEGKKIEMPNNPTKEGYIFKGWMLNGDDYNFELEVTEDLELTAKWDKKSSNNVNNNNITSNQNKEENIKVNVPTLTSGGGAPGVAILEITREGIYKEEGYRANISGWELYEKNGSEYKLVKSEKVTGTIEVTVDKGESKTYVARAYALNKSGKKVYSGYSNEYKFDNSKVDVPTLTAGGGAPGVAILEVTREGIYKEEGYRANISGWELYEKNGSEYKLVKSEKVTGTIEVTVDKGESKIYVARAYALNKSGKKVYSGYSNEYKFDNSKVDVPTLTAGGGAPGVAILEITREGIYKEEGYRANISGWELYEKNGSEYKLVKSEKVTGTIEVTVDKGESKIYVARAYALNKSGKKVYSGYSNEFVLKANY